MQSALVVGLLVLQGIVAFFAWPNFILPDANGLSALLVFLVYFPTFLFILAVPAKKQFLITGLSGVTVFLSGLHYFFVIKTHHWSGAIIALLLVVYAYAAYGLLARWCRWLYLKRRPYFILLAPALYAAIVSIQTMASQYLWFVPYNAQPLSFPLTGIPALMQMVSITGMVGTEFLVLFVSAAMAVAVWEGLLSWPSLLGRLGLSGEHQPLDRANRAKALQTGTIIAVILIGLGIWGNTDAWQTEKRQKSASRSLRVALLQAQYAASRGEFSQANQKGAVLLYRRMSLEAAKQGAELLGFTENAFPAVFPESKDFWNDLCQIFSEVKIPGFFEVITQVSQTPKIAMNVWYHIGADGKLKQTYAKQYLLPFGEYIPLRPVVQAVVDASNFFFRTTYQLFKLTAVEWENYDLTPGTMPNVFTLPQAKVTIGVCAENQFPGLFRQGILQGGEMIFIPSTVDWFVSRHYFGREIERCRFRAVESRRWVAATYCLGSSFFIDAVGQIRKIAPIGKRSVLVETVPLLQAYSVYTRIGDWLGGLLFILVLGYSIQLATRKKV